MAKTVLEYVQASLSAMNSDEVDDIADTTESMQVAEQLEEVYYELLNREEWPWLHGPIVLEAVGDTDHPTEFLIPEDVKYVNDVSYNVSESTGYKRKELCYLEPLEFLKRFSVGEDDSTKQLITLGSQIFFYISNDRWPEYWTSFDDETIVCDAFYEDYGATLVAGRLSAYGVLIPEFEVNDEFEVPVPKHIQPLLQAELNRECFQYFKQIESVPDERKARRQLARARRESSKITRDQDVYYTNNFGRRPAGRYSRAAR